VASQRSSSVVIALALVVAGCGSAPVEPSPAASLAAPASAGVAGSTGVPAPSAGPASAGVPESPGPASPVPASAAPPASGPTIDPWLAADVAEPAAVTTAPSLQPGYRCHPCHFLAENQFLGVGESASGPIAVGVQEPPAQAVAFSSADGAHWTPLPGFSGAPGSTAIATASNGRRAVIVGLDHSGATAWAFDGRSWMQAPRQADLLVPYAAGAMTSVAPFGDGFIAGGYRDDPLHAAAAAAAWRSADGLTWHADDGSGPFAGGRIWGIAAKGGTIVAVGTSGDPNYGPAAAWRWTAADGWQRGRIGPDAGGAMRAVVVTASGFVAVGLNGHDLGALTWTSVDGLAWTAAPDQPAFHYFLMPLRMQSVVVGPSGLVAGGWRSDVAKGSAVTWTSKDGTTWQGPVWETSFSGGQITGLTVDGGAVVAVGRTGYPDWNQASAWVSRVP
jgi:hypothetical protein